MAESDSGTGPAVRLFPTGSNVLFAFQILNANANPQNLPELDIQTKLFRDGKEVYASVPAPFDPTGQSDLSELEVSIASPWVRTCRRANMCSRCW